MHAEAGIDYLTFTINEGNEDYVKCIRAATRLQEVCVRGGNTLRPNTVLGYEGSICGTVFVGIREGDCMVRISGAMAHEAYKPFKSLDIKPTRLDLQVTVWYDDNPAEIIRKYAEIAIADANVADVRTKRTIRKVESNDGGFTLYIGSRTSDYFARLYDKHKESKDATYLYALRFEVEIKGKRAQQAFNALSSRSRDISPQVLSFVAEWYAARGVHVPFLFKAGKMELSPINREKSDTARRLAWLRGQVRGTILELRKVIDTNDILEALGFFEPLDDL